MTELNRNITAIIPGLNVTVFLNKTNKRTKPLLTLREKSHAGPEKKAGSHFHTYHHRLYGESGVPSFGSNLLQ